MQITITAKSKCILFHTRCFALCQCGWIWNYISIHAEWARIYTPIRRKYQPPNMHTNNAIIFSYEKGQALPMQCCGVSESLCCAKTITSTLVSTNAAIKRWACGQQQQQSTSQRIIITVRDLYRIKIDKSLRNSWIKNWNSHNRYSHRPKTTTKKK